MRDQSLFALELATAVKHQVLADILQLLLYLLQLLGAAMVFGVEIEALLEIGAESRSYFGLLAVSDLVGLL